MAIIQYKNNQAKVYQIDDADEIHRGGEGRIMLLKGINDKVAKLYHQGIPAITENKFKFLSTLDKQLFVIPEELLYLNNKVCGFLMSYVGKDLFPISAIFSRNFCIRNNISEDLKIKICEKLIESVIYAHKSKIVIGDFNQYNVLVNNKAEIKLIDTDSYQSPEQKHSGILLEDIRDYLYGGAVCETSDFFALSVLLFYTFTHTHPFKGIHKTYKKLSDRMIHKLPVFLKTPDIVVPKVYNPISDKKLLLQFEELYVQGRRFLISLTGTGQISPQVQPVKTTKIAKKDLIISPILENSDISDIYFLSDKGYIETKENFIIFDTKNKSYITNLFTLSKNIYKQVYISNSNILVRKDNKLFHYVSETQIVELTNIKIGETCIVSIYDDIMLIIDEDVMFTVYMNDITNNSIRNKRTEVLGKSFSFHTGLFQNIGGVGRIFYNSGKDLTNVKIEKKIKEIKQTGNTGIIKYTENNVLKTSYFKINGMKTEISDKDIEELYDFAFMPVGNGEGMIFEPSEEEIKVIRTNDFQVVTSLECEFVSGLSKLQYCKSGIILWEGRNVYLLNKN